MKTQQSDSTLLKWGLFLALMIILILLWINHHAEESSAGVGQYVAATRSKQVADIPKVQQPIKNGSVAVYASHAKKKLKLPAAIADDPKQQVIESTTVKSDDHPQTINTIVNTDTGETQTIVRKEPLPWLAWDDHGEIGIYGGIKNGSTAARLEAKQGIVQMKAVHVGVVASVDQQLSASAGPDYFVGVGAWYRW